MKNDICWRDVVMMSMLLFVFINAMVGGILILPAWVDRCGQWVVIPIVLVWDALLTELIVVLLGWHDKDDGEKS
jgi:hypothetical protein